MVRTQSSSQSGQIALIVLLMMVVLMTVGLSIARQATVSLYDSQLEQDSTRVLNAAEAGIEQALSTDLQPGEFQLSQDAFPNIAVDYQVNELNTLDIRLFEGVSAEVNVVGVTTGHSLVIDWSREDNCSTQNPASLLLSIYSSVAGVTSVRYVPVASCNRGEGLPVVGSSNNDGYRRRYTLPLVTNDIFVRVKPLYNDTHIRVTSTGPSWSLPVQGYAIRSDAAKDSGETRSIEIKRSLPTQPSVFDYALYSSGAITK